MKRLFTSLLLLLTVITSVISPVFSSEVSAQQENRILSIQAVEIGPNNVKFNIDINPLAERSPLSYLLGYNSPYETGSLLVSLKEQGGTDAPIQQNFSATKDELVSFPLLKNEVMYEISARFDRTIHLPGGGEVETAYTLSGTFTSLAAGAEIQNPPNPPIIFTQGGTIINNPGTNSAEVIYNAQQGTPVAEPLPPCLSGTTLDIGGCITRLIYYGLYVPTSWLFLGGAQLFDLVFEHSIASESYKSPFITEGWTLIRDISNIFFIFILLYIAIGTILDLKGVEWKKMIANVVLIGVAINFSLFFTRLIIDISNITARVFHQSDVVSIKRPNGESATISEAIVGAANPQNLTTQSGKIDTLGDKATTAQSTVDTVPKTVLGFIIIILIAVAVNIYGAWIFITVAGAFIGRIIGLWLSLLFSPFAFITYAIPPSFNFGGDFKFNKWWENLWELSIMAPIFMFFLYLILLFIQTGFDSIFKTSSTGSDLNAAAWVLSIIIPFAIILGLFKKAKDITVDLSGSAGKMISGWTSKLGALAVGGAAGLAVGGLATGGARFGQRTAGRAGAKLANSDRVQELKASDNWFARKTGTVLEKVGKKTSEASFDARKIGIVQSGIQQVEKSTGMKIGSNQFLDSQYMGEKDTKGGYTQNIKDKTKRKEEFMKGIKTNASQEDIDKAKHKYSAAYKETEQFTQKKAYYESLGYSSAGADEAATKDFAAINEHAAYQVKLTQHLKSEYDKDPATYNEADATKAFKDKNKAPIDVKTPKDLEKARKEKVRQRYEREGKNKNLKAAWSTEAKSSAGAAKTKPTEKEKIEARLSEIEELKKQYKDGTKLVEKETLIIELSKELKKMDIAYDAETDPVAKKALAVSMAEKQIEILNARKTLKEISDLDKEETSLIKRKNDLDAKEKDSKEKDK